MIGGDGVPSSASVDVCVVTYRSADTVADLLRSVADHLPGAAVRICDNSPDEDTARAVAEHVGAHPGPVVDLGRARDNPGFGAACNRLAAASRAQWLLFVNPDAIVTSFDLDLASQPPGVVVGAVVRDPSGRLQVTSGRDRTLGREASIRLLRRRPASSVPSVRTRVDFVSGAAFAVRREDFERWGGFDAERYFMYYEDIDLCRRVRESGGHVVIDPAWRVTHIGGHSAKQAHVEALVRSYRSAANYHRRWSLGWWLFRPICVIEALVKTALAIPRGRVGQTSLATQRRFLWFLVGGRPG